MLNGDHSDQIMQKFCRGKMSKFALKYLKITDLAFFVWKIIYLTKNHRFDLKLWHNGVNSMLYTTLFSFVREMNVATSKTLWKKSSQIASMHNCTCTMYIVNPALNILL